jgi:hypothetical protein
MQKELIDIIDKETSEDSVGHNLLALRIQQSI